MEIITTNHDTLINTFVINDKKKLLTINSVLCSDRKMWSNSFLSHLSKVAGHGGETSKKGPAIRYSAIPSDGVPSTFLRGPQVFLDLDVEDTVTCFCRFV